MVKIRHCRKCLGETRHDATTELDENSGIVALVDRVMFGLSTLGLSEVANRKLWKCQRCDIITSRVG